MKCIHCGRTPQEHGVALFRQNAKGQPGVWACEEHNALPVDEGVAAIVAAVQSPQEKKH